MKETRKRIINDKCLAEFLGTGVFLFLGMGCVAALKLSGAVYGQWEISIIWGLAVALGVYLTAGVSGAHLNPAVTIALWLFAGFQRCLVLPYIISQLLGAFCAAILVYLLYQNLFIDMEQSMNMVRGSENSIALAGIFTTFPHNSISLVQAFFVETIITSILVALILAIGDDKNGVPNGPLAPLLIGLVVAAIGAAFGPLTGFAMNPARDFGPRLFAFFAGWDVIALTGGKSFPYLFIPIIAPVMGGCLGAWVYKHLIECNVGKN